MRLLVVGPADTAIHRPFSFFINGPQWYNPIADGSKGRSFGFIPRIFI
jgi:hypothetical protein